MIEHDARSPAAGRFWRWHWASLPLAHQPAAPTIIAAAQGGDHLKQRDDYRVDIVRTIDPFEIDDEIFAIP